MDRFEDRLARLTPRKAPEALWEKIREGQLARPRRAAFSIRDAGALAAAAVFLAALSYILLAPVVPDLVPAQEGDLEKLKEELRGYPHRIVTESFRDGNWELYLFGADGSNPANLTKTADLDELYPKVSPDGTKICFACDEGKGESKIRNLYVMNLDGTDRKKIATNGREPCWKADSSAVAYLPAELEKFTYSDFATKGIRIYDLKTGDTREHPNKAIHHLYTLNWSPDGKWFVATVHGGMGFKHGILALEAEGEGVHDLKLGGCRPDLSPDGKRIAWGNGDHAIGVADLDFSSGAPKALNPRNVVESKDPMETYHVDWAPDGKYVAFSYGPKLKGKNLKGLLPEFPGVEAPDWNLCVADVSKKNLYVALTTDGKSNKEPDWAPAK
jgi:Tol biopolymer transport system component